MPLVEVTCPRCHAPLEPPAQPTSIIKCRFCGASFRDTSAPAAQTRIVPAIVLERVGPSNRARAWDILTKVGGLPPAEAERVIQEAPCEAFRLEHWERAEEIAFALREAGVTARVEEREIVIPPPVVLPDRSVMLDAVGEKKAAVMKVLRTELDCDVIDAKRMVDHVPCVVAKALEGGRAAAFVEALNAAGATAKLGTPS